MRKGTDLLNKLRIPNGIPSEVDYNKIQDDGGGWTIDPKSKKFPADIRETLHSIGLSNDEKDYDLIAADQDKPYIAENGEINEVSSDYINRDFQSFRHSYLSTRAYSNTIVKDFYLIATLLIGRHHGSIH